MGNQARSADVDAAVREDPVYGAMEEIPGAVERARDDGETVLAGGRRAGEDAPLA